MTETVAVKSSMLKISSWVWLFKYINKHYNDLLNTEWELFVLTVQYTVRRTLPVYTVQCIRKFNSLFIFRMHKWIALISIDCYEKWWQNASIERIVFQFSFSTRHLSLVLKSFNRHRTISTLAVNYSSYRLRTCHFNFTNRFHPIGLKYL